MNIFRKKKYFLFKSFVKVDLRYVFTINLFTIAETARKSELSYKNRCLSLVCNYLRPSNNYRQSRFNINAVVLILIICKDLRNWQNANRNFSFFAVFLKNRNIISKIKRSKVTDYAALKLWFNFHLACRGCMFILNCRHDCKQRSICRASFKCVFYFFKTL